MHKHEPSLRSKLRYIRALAEIEVVFPAETFRERVLLGCDQCLPGQVAA